jgi:glycosyltransferase involved in cell wall biosynthesis
MKILHLSPAYFPVVGGSEVHIQELSEGLARRGHEVTVLTTRTSIPGGAAPSETINGVQVLRFAEATAFRRLLEFPGAFRSLRAVLGPEYLRVLVRGPLSARLFGELLRREADVVGVIGWWATALPLQACAAKRMRRLRLVGIPLFHTEEAWSQEPLQARLLARCDALITNTTHEKRFIDERTGGRVPAHVAGVGIHPSHFEGGDGTRIRTRYGLGNAPVVGFTGRLLPGKGVTKLIEAMRTVWRVNDQARLLLAGPRTLPGSQADRDVDAALALLTADERARVVEMGRFDEADKASIFESFDIFAMPSVAESFGIAYLEAWMCRKPVVGGRIEATRCVIDEGRDGLLADPHDPEDIAAAILKLLGDPEGRLRMGQAGYEKASSRYTWERVVDRVEHVYLSLLGSSPSKASP